MRIGLPQSSDAERVEVDPGCGEPGHDRLGVAEQQLARPRQLHRPRAARPVEQPVADVALERRDLLADRRLRVAEPQRRGAEGALLGDRLQGGEVAHLDAEPEIVLRPVSRGAHRAHCYASQG